MFNTLLVVSIYFFHEPCNGYVIKSRANIHSKHSSLHYYSNQNETDLVPSLTFVEFPPNALSAWDYAKSQNALKPWESLMDLVTIPSEPSFEQIMKSAKSTRLLKYRSYAKRDAFSTENIHVPPSSKDLSPKTRNQLEILWINPLYRWAILVLSYLIFPCITQFLAKYITTTSTHLAEITMQFGPGISILYGTFISITLSILYDRQNKIQTNISAESANMAIVLRSSLSLFRDNKDRMVEVGQCVADQIRHLVMESRGEEIMCLIYSDPYARILELVLEKEREHSSNDHPDGVCVHIIIKKKEFSCITIHSCYHIQFVTKMSISCAKDSIKELIKMRSQRLSEEALALPPTHFFVLTTLTILILLGYIFSILPTVSPTGMPSTESSILFSVLCTVYILFYNFADDLNNPFQGVYQIRRSSTAAHLLQTKWLLVNHPVLKGKIHFDRVNKAQGSEQNVYIKTPGVGMIPLCDITFDNVSTKD